jgi:hypothetical protein
VDAHQDIGVVAFRDFQSLRQVLSLPGQGVGAGIVKTTVPVPGEDGLGAGSPQFGYQEPGDSQGDVLLQGARLADRPRIGPAVSGVDDDDPAGQYRGQGGRVRIRSGGTCAGRQPKNQEPI